MPHFGLQLESWRLYSVLSLTISLGNQICIVFVYIYIYIYVCMYMCVWICMCTYIHIYIYTYIYIHIYIYIYTYIYIYASIHPSMHVRKGWLADDLDLAFWCWSLLRRFSLQIQRPCAVFFAARLRCVVSLGKFLKLTPRMETALHS